MAYKHNNLLVVSYVGERLKKIRESKGLTRADVAKALGYAISSIANWELGKHNLALDVMYLYCSFLGVDPLDIMPSPQYIQKLKQKTDDNASN